MSGTITGPCMGLLDELVERRIREAAERGEFDDLPGRGRPLRLEEDALVPEELRAGYRLLKNAGYLPPALQPHGELRRIEQLLARIEDTEARAGLEADRRRLRRKLQMLGRDGRIWREPAYCAALSRKTIR